MDMTTGVRGRTDNEGHVNFPERRVLEWHARGGVVSMLLGDRGVRFSMRAMPQTKVVCFNRA
ncbi:hypothetical protein ABIC50_002579 [Burkholderia sp. 567]